MGPTRHAPALLLLSLCVVVVLLCQLQWQAGVQSALREEVAFLRSSLKEKCPPCSTATASTTDTISNERCKALVNKAEQTGADTVQFPSNNLTLCSFAGYCVRNPVPQTERTEVSALAGLYLYTLRQSLLGTLLGTDSFVPGVGARLKRTAHRPAKRLVGGDWPSAGMSMIGVKRMENLHLILHRAYLIKRLDGGFLETGVWRGGACIYAKGFMTAHNITQPVYVVDSFAGLPRKEHPGDAKFWHYMQYLQVPEAAVADNFERYALFDSGVVFVKGWFHESLPPFVARHSPRLAVLRLDGDMYKSTLAVLCSLYATLLVGGFWIVDDWEVPAARHAITDFVGNHSITDVGQPIEGNRLDSSTNKGAFFEKIRDVTIDTTWCATEIAREVVV